MRLGWRVGALAASGVAAGASGAVLPIANELETDFFRLRCALHTSAGSCNADRCRWEGGRCRELRCASRMRWRYSGDARHRFQSSVSDFMWGHDADCPDLPFASAAGEYPAGSLTGNPPDPGSFDRTGSAGDRLAWVTAVPNVPFSVDVDLLTDAQILSTCLTVDQCAFPPLLTVVRRAKDRSLWQPSLGALPGGVTTKRLPTYLVNGDDPAVRGDAITANSNYQLLKLLPPMTGGGAKLWGGVSGLSQRFFPRNATAATAKIVRIDFSFGRERLYAYLDLTCGAARGFSRRNGFLGQNQARPNGIFHELMYVPPGRMPNTHGPMRADIGVSTRLSDYGAGAGSFKLSPIFAFTGPEQGRRLKWVTWWQSWMKLSRLTSSQMVAAYIKTGLEWAFLLPPRGNMPVTILYFYAAQVEYSKMPRGAAVDFSAVATFSAQFYLEMKPALDWLVSRDRDTGQPNFAKQSLIGSQCMRDLPAQFTQPFLGGWAPPEIACGGAAINCPTWCSLACKPFWTVVQQARNFSLASTIAEVPKCSRCPGLLGVFREDTSGLSDLRNHSMWFPQCLPFVSSSGKVYNDPIQLSGVTTMTPTTLPTMRPSALPTAAPSSAAPRTSAPSSTEAPSEAPNTPTTLPTMRPSALPTAAPSSAAPSTSAPSSTEAPSEAPNTAPGGSRRRSLSLQGEQHELTDHKAFISDMYRDTDTELRRLWELPEVDVVDLLDERDPRRVAIVGNRTAGELRGRLLRARDRVVPSGQDDHNPDFVVCSTAPGGGGDQ
jgi:hypothetical protein